MPDLGELIGQLIRFIGDAVSASSLRHGIGPTLAILGVVGVLLQLVARPVTRWEVRDLGGLAGVTRTMAIAAEAGGSAAFSLGTAGLVRAAAATSRLQTLAALPILAHVARAAARAGVPLRVTSNDPLATLAASATLDESHRQTATPERRGRSRAAFVGEGRAAPAGLAFTRPHEEGDWVMGGLGEEAILMVAASAGTADAGQAGTILLAADATLIGPELYQAPADLRPAGIERTSVIAGNRLLLATVSLLLLGSALAVAGGLDIRPILLGAS